MGHRMIKGKQKSTSDCLIKTTVSLQYDNFPQTTSIKTVSET